MNSSDLDFERHGRLSVFLGLARLQSLTRRYPDAPFFELLRIASAVSSGYATADWATAQSIASVFSDLVLDEDATSMRRFLDRLLVHDRPLWLVACVRGRSAARTAMPPGVRQCLSFAQVLGHVPDDEALRWWDALVGAQREVDDLVLKERGREGERMTLSFETERLRSLGIAQKPQWMALDDEGLGYDVLSYDIDAGGELQNRMIEVKACSGRSLDIYVSRGEWQLAEQASNAYRFHVWHLPTQRLAQFSVADLAPHVPDDCGRGTWQSVRIPLPATPVRP